MCIYISWIHNISHVFLLPKYSNMLESTSLYWEEDAKIAQTIKVTKIYKKNMAPTNGLKINKKREKHGRHHQARRCRQFRLQRQKGSPGPILKPWTTRTLVPRGWVRASLAGWPIGCWGIRFDPWGQTYMQHTFQRDDANGSARPRPDPSVH
jgi:hypothetical protein